MSEQTETSRRSFLGFMIWAIGGLISMGVGVPAFIYVIAPSLQRKTEESWIRVGSTSKIELGTPTLFKLKIKRQVGWNVTEEEIAVYVITENGRDFNALSNICTHLGCRVRWVSDQDQFFCPCHNAIFNKDGTVVAGPPPRPLDQFQVKVENEQLYILGG